MRKISLYLIFVIILALAVHIVWIAIAPLIPYIIGVLIAFAVLGLFYFRKRF